MKWIASWSLGFPSKNWTTITIASTARWQYDSPTQLIAPSTDVRHPDTAQAIRRTAGRKSPQIHASGLAHALLLFPSMVPTDRERERDEQQLHTLRRELRVLFAARREKRRLITLRACCVRFPPGHVRAS